MAKPYIFWETSLNADLVTRSSGDPLVISAGPTSSQADIAKIEKLIAQTSRPVLFDDTEIGYQQSVSYGQKSAQERGIGIFQGEFLPQSLTFPAPGPDPFDLSESFSSTQFRLINLGFQMMLRGWVGTMLEGGLNGQFVVGLIDEEIRSQGDERGAWTGMTVGLSNRNNDRVDHVFDVLHGKRAADTDWLMHGGHLDRVPGGTEQISESTYSLNSVISSQFRIVISGGSPLWNISCQRKDGLNWVDVHTAQVDLRSHVSGDIANVALAVSMFSATIKNRPGTLPSELASQTIWGRYFELSQFEPWVIDISEWSERGWSKHWQWLTGTYTAYALELMRPKTDLVHFPMGTDNAPAELRASDPELGICMQLGSDTILKAIGISDNRYVDPDVGPGPEPIAVCDIDMFGASAPFAAYSRIKPISLNTLVNERSIFSFGDAYNPSPSISQNGLGLLWRPLTGNNTRGKFVAVCFDQIAGKVEFESEEYESGQWSDKAIDIGVAWTGIRGASSGLPNWQLRVVLNGQTILSGIVDNFYLSNSGTSFVGSDGTAQALPMLFRSMVLYGEAVTNYELEQSFVFTTDSFGNHSFETPSESGRPGEADLWSWISVQTKGGWAEFNAYDPTLDRWRTDTELFGPGWNELENWINDFESTEYIFALFNGGSELYRAIFEMFGIWGRQWSGGFEWSGPPWRDDFVLRQPATDVLGPGDGPSGFNGWYDSSLGTNLLPKLFELFGEAFGTDPFGGLGGPTWYSGTAIDSYQFGKAITEPISIPPDKNKFVVWVDSHGAMELEITPGEYNSAGHIASHLNTLLAPYYSGGGGNELMFEAWTINGESGLKFGVPESPHWPLYLSAAAMFGCLESEKSGDARELLGLVGLGPGGRRSDIICTREMLGDLNGEDSGDIFCLDSWSLLEFTQLPGSGETEKLTAPYGMEFAYFEGSNEITPVEYERFTLVGWFGGGAVWLSGFGTGDYPGPGGLSFADFEEGTGTSIFEKFNPDNWPEEIWT